MVFYLLLAAFAALICVLIVRTLRFTPRQTAAPYECDVHYDGDTAVSALQQLIRCKTVSYFDACEEDNAEFEKLISLLPGLYPNVFKACTLERLPERALLFRWPGRAHSAPSVMMAHYDVVPADAERWEKPPFEGIIENGVLWGRGALDTKVTFNAVLSAADALIAEGFVPDQDVYFAFSGGEEINGNGAANIVKRFEETGVRPALVVDEGGAVVEGVFPGVKAPCGLIGIAEKGTMNVTFSASSSGGHASAPLPHTPVGILARACCAVENHPFPLHITKPAAEMFDTLGRHSSFLFRMLFANLWLFKGVLDLLCRKTGGELNALLRTTVAFTQSSASPAPNVIPPSASLTANVRINPADSSTGARARFIRTIRNKNISVSLENVTEPSPVSETGCAAWNKVASAVSGTWPGCIVSPYLMVQCSDSRHYRDLSNHVYRFSAMALTNEERRTIHGHDERIRLETVKKAVEFYIRLLRQC